jgi:hypothetical protein
LEISNPGCFAPCAIIAAPTSARHGCIMADCSCPFEDPITLPDGRTLSTLRDAASYLMALPGKTRQSDEWQAAIEALLMAAENRGPLMHARIGMLRALNRHVERVFDSSREAEHWGRRKRARYRWPIGFEKSISRIIP